MPMDSYSYPPSKHTKEEAAWQALIHRGSAAS